MAAESGLLAWSNAIRFTMANDPGRQVFQEQVNKHGFLFLDDYLNNILSGANQDPMIELVKTPARKKPTHKAHLSSKSGLSRIYSNVTEDGNKENKENSTVLNSFNQALLKSKEMNPQIVTPLTLANKSNPTPEDKQEISSAPERTSQTAETLPPADANLSVIAEDEEMSDRDPTVFHTPSSERAPISAQGSQMLDANTRMPDEQAVPSNPPPEEPVDEAVASSTIPLQATKEQSSPPPAIPVAEPASAILVEEEAVVDLPAIPIVRSSSSSSSSETIPVLQEERVGKTAFPSFPGPAPLRKSMRLPQEASSSNHTIPLGAPTPGAPPGGKRTSWLKKAREVKAMESLTRVGSSTSSQPTSNPLKRKSDETAASQTQTASDADIQERPRKSLKVNAEQTASSPVEAQTNSETSPKEVTSQPSNPPSVESTTATSTPFGAQEGMLDRLKKTVEGLGARVGKSFGNALGTGSAASALAEARAAAEARIAQRNSQDDGDSRPDSPPPPQTIRLVNAANAAAQDKRLSVSDLFPPTDTAFKIKSRAGSKSPSPKLQIGLTTKFLKEGPFNLPRSPLQSPTSRQLPNPPIGVFDRPQPVFVPPVPSSPIGPRAKNPFTFQSGTSKNVFAAPLNTSGLRSATSPKREPESQHGKSNTVPAWSSTIDDTDFSMAFNSKKTAQELDDDDDSWPIDEKLPPGVQWNFSAKDDSLTWSTLRSESQRGDTGTWRTAEAIAEESRPATPGHKGEIPDMMEEDDLDSEMEVVDLTENVTTTTNFEPGANEIQRSNSQLSMASSQGSFSSTASKSTLNPPGTAKKGKPEVKKVLQMAAVAAKKQQEESDKKAARLKDMEARRQAAQQKKAEEEKQKALEQERKLKEEEQRRKREREETTDKRPLKQTTKKEDDAFKKRKLTTNESDKKELKKVPSKSVLKPSLKQPTVPSTTSIGGPKPVEIKKPTTAWKGKAKAVPKMPANLDDDVSHPSQMVQTQMAARVETQIQASKAPEKVQSESIELPDINSEYSDSEDEDRKRTYDPPDWAQSPELKEALRMQSTINPDDIFGAVKPLKMEEIFKSRTSRFRARTSSANWAGTDGLTLAEEREYARRMGFR